MTQAVMPPRNDLCTYLDVPLYWYTNHGTDKHWYTNLFDLN